MAVVVDFVVQGATAEQMYQVEQLTIARGEAAGAPPFDGCMFIAAAAAEDGFRFVSAWRTQAAFEAVLEAMLGPDLGSVGLAPSGIQVSTAAMMAIPGVR